MNFIRILNKIRVKKKTIWITLIDISQYALNNSFYEEIPLNLQIKFLIEWKQMYKIDFIS